MTQAEKKNDPERSHERDNEPKSGGQRDPGDGQPSTDEKNGDGRRNGSESGGGKDGNS
ncbi:hypothetical protein [Deinococcus radiodurans]|jgi:hypothetical protein|uniref:Uncharacterized protein n=1 Tax=Deinococcus radiodurans (strain ATCC 13939 / DSM 20539 / JCM 16871 / CCUG 27074 / LMG 4051 / NBRC 15346 / NCIMB 9279 / VKM B-1422 / R1) TaxID=243230 RepID=Q9RYS4_DEIRA|nr:hypothetical protein [Deinococcus radiodurans]AAF12494.1 hypothetical protein DR_A0234 [Deinococcus radiodurans R1 = ATCC 13939 = DSM 20539]QEM73036.1 hypothetical protein DXG80_14635 [Deinococcus radiodurans]QIP30247.1 hypothetical protein HAV23_13535 [Deinococcus radiodurans]QIP33156.1 hypothetical protein HAV35_14460 [Deinococcus radiodurans]UDL02002.1 hypothetical protein E5E91_14865 [Deinococcus radiodurans R1 = ATCC 13939 = DSM 20539]